MSNSNLKGKILRGGISLTLRQLLVAALSAISILVVARELGPASYGIFTIASGIFYFLIRVCRMGLNVYLVRHPDLPENGASQILGFYNTVGLAICVLLWCATPLAGWWTGRVEVTWALQCLIPAVWLDMVSSVSMSMLERELRFVEVGLIEGVAQFANYGLSIVLVLLGWGFWGPVLGTASRFVLQSALTRHFQPIAWSWHWQKQFLRPALRYGLTYSGSDWILGARNLRVPILVSRLVSVEAAGIVSIAIRLVEQLALLRLVIRRMSISVMAKLIHDPIAARSALSRGMTYQALLIGVVCVGFAGCAAWLVPLLFGEKWLPSLQIFPFIALGTLVSAIFDLHSAALYAADHNREVAQFNSWYVGILWGASLLLLPLMGLWGFGWAEVIALPSCWLIHRSLSRLMGSPNYWNAAWLVLAAAPLLFGGIFLPSPWWFAVAAFNYGMIFLCNASIRSLTLELIASRLKRKT